MTEAKPTLIKRSVALRKLEYPLDSKLRNYEIEHLLEAKFPLKTMMKGEWIIAEWCPFNGINCLYSRVASVPDLEEALLNCEASGVFEDFVIRDIKLRIKLRTRELEDEAETIRLAPLHEKLRIEEHQRKEKEIKSLQNKLLAKTLRPHRPVEDPQIQWDRYRFWDLNGVDGEGI